MAINITADPGVITFIPRGTLSLWPSAEPNPLLNLTFNCASADRFGNYDQGVGVMTFTAYGTWLNVNIDADPGVITFTPLGDYVEGILITADPGVITFSGGSSDVLLERFKSNWAKWSDIGNLDFTIWKDNVAGEMPLDWKGWIWNIKKLGSKVVYYGENGVSVLTPSGRNFGLNTVYRIGLKGKNAVAGDDNNHYFIDNKGQLFYFGTKLEKLDYSEYLNDLTDPVLSWDAENYLLYICDGTYGFVYSPRSKSLGKGPVNITGVSSQSGTFYAVSPAAIVTPDFEICTDIYDMGTRRLKTIFMLEYGIDLEMPLQAAIDYRSNKASGFSQTAWHNIDGAGKARITCNGREFRFRAKASSYEYFEIDYINVNGEVLSH